MMDTGVSTAELERSPSLRLSGHANRKCVCGGLRVGIPSALIGRSLQLRSSARVTRGAHLNSFLGAQGRMVCQLLDVHVAGPD